MLQPRDATDPVMVGSYRILGRLPGGGMATVYLGQEPRGRVFAVKVARADPDGQYAARFPDELQASRRVHGRYIAEVVGLDPFASPPWLATEYVPGPSLREVVRTYGRLDEAPVRALGAGLCDALACIHAAGVVHGDLTPNNVLLTDDGPRVIDFGISGFLGSTTTLDPDRARFGTRGYYGPERDDAATDRPHPSGDVYALGAVLWFALTGQSPAPHPPGALPCDHLPEALRELVAACVAADPADRPDVGEVQTALLPRGMTVTTALAAHWPPRAAAAEIEGRRAELASFMAGHRAAPEPPTERLPAARTAAPAPTGPPPAAPPPTRRGWARAALAVLGVLAIGATAWALGIRPDRTGGVDQPTAPSTAAATTSGTSASAPAGTEPSPCVFETRPPSLARLPYQCTLVWAESERMTSVPVFRTHTAEGLTEADRIDSLNRRTGDQYFTCHVRGAAYHFPAQSGLAEADHDWWALTQGDANWWGFVPETYLLGGDDFVPDAGLPTCRPEEIAMAGRRSD